MENGDILERVKFRYFIVLSLILHLFFLIIFRVKFEKKVEGFNPTYVRIVELPSLSPFTEKEAEITSKPKSINNAAKKIVGGGLGPLLLKSQRLYDSTISSPQETSGGMEEVRKSGNEEGRKADPESSSGPKLQDTTTPLPHDPSKKGIMGLPLITDKDLERFAKVEEPSLKKKEKSITLDTDEFKYISYLERLKSRIEFIWEYPEIARHNRLQGDLFIRFSILKSGRLGNTQLLRSSGYKVLDDAALQALKNSDPFWPLPENWGLEELSVTGHFIYYLGGLYLR